MKPVICIANKAMGSGRRSDRCSENCSPKLKDARDKHERDHANQVHQEARNSVSAPQPPDRPEHPEWLEKGQDNT